MYNRVTHKNTEIFKILEKVAIVNAFVIYLAINYWHRDLYGNNIVFNTLKNIIIYM